MDEGTNEHGLRWEVEDQRMINRGFKATLWKEGEEKPRAARQGFSTREAAVEWAGKHEGGRYSLVPIVLLGAGVALWFGIMALTIRALIRGNATVNVGVSPVVVRHRWGGGGGGWARPRPRARGG